MSLDRNFSAPLWPYGVTVIYAVCHWPKCHYAGTAWVYYVHFSVYLFSINGISVRFNHECVDIAIVWSFLLLCSSPFYGPELICFPLKDFWIASHLGLLWIKPPCTFLKNLSVAVALFPFGLCPGMETLGIRAGICLAWIDNVSFQSGSANLQVSK